MSDSDLKNDQLALVFRYGQQAMQFVLTRDPQIRDELRKIEKDLGMTAEEIMDEAMRNTDPFKSQDQLLLVLEIRGMRNYQTSSISRRDDSMDDEMNAFFDDAGSEYAM